MKMDKRIAKWIIAAIVLIAIVATAPVLSSANVALAQQSQTPILKVQNINHAPTRGPNCSVGDFGVPSQYCPQGGDKGGITTITVNPGEADQKSYTFESCSWGIPCVKTYDIPVGSKYKITATVPTNWYSFNFPEKKDQYPDGFAFRHDSTYIGAQRNGCYAGPVAKPGIAECTARMTAAGAEIHVGYYWTSEILGGGGGGVG